MMIPLEAIRKVLEGTEFELKAFLRSYDSHNITYVSRQNLGSCATAEIECAFEVEARLALPEKLKPSRKFLKLKDAEVKLEGLRLVEKDAEIKASQLPNLLREHQTSMAKIDRYFSKNFINPRFSYLPEEQIISYDKYGIDPDLRHYRSCCSEGGRLKFISRSDNEVLSEIVEGDIPYALSYQSGNIGYTLFAATRGLIFVAKDLAKENWQHQIAAFHAYFAYKYGRLPLPSQAWEAADIFQAPRDWKDWLNSQPVSLSRVIRADASLLIR